MPTMVVLVPDQPGSDPGGGVVGEEGGEEVQPPLGQGDRHHLHTVAVQGLGQDVFLGTCSISWLFQRGKTALKSGRLETPGQVESEGVPRLRKIRNSWGGVVRRGKRGGAWHWF